MAQRLQSLEVDIYSPAVVQFILANCTNLRQFSMNVVSAGLEEWDAESNLKHLVSLSLEMVADDKDLICLNTTERESKASTSSEIHGEVIRRLTANNKDLKVKTPYDPNVAILYGGTVSVFRNQLSERVYR